MSSIITLTDYHLLTGSSNSSSDPLITELITVVSNKVEEYCDRIFEAADYEETFRIGGNCSRTHRSGQFPINNIQLIGTPQTALEITNNSASNSYTINIQDNTMLVNDQLLASNSYSLTDNSFDTLTELETQLETDTSLLVDVKTDVSQLSRLLFDKTLTIGESGNVNIDGVKVGGVARIEDEGTFYFDVGGTYFIVYNAGYTAANMPDGLKYLVAQMVKTSLEVSESKIDPKYKSQSITNYSYTLMDTVDLNNVIQAYSEALNAWKRIHI